MKNIRKYKGVYTIEAALIMPMILTVIVLIIYWAFFLHDRAILSNAAYTACLRGSQMINSENVEGELNKICKDLYNNRLLATTDVSYEIKSGSKDITVTYYGNIKIPAGTLLCKYMTDGKNVIEVKASGKAQICDAVKFIRDCRLLENAYSSIKK